MIRSAPLPWRRRQESGAGPWVSADPAAAVLTPPVLSMIGRGLSRTGQVLFVVDVVDGRRVLTPASSWDVLGSAAPSSWRFKYELAGRDTSVTRTVGWEAVCLLTWAVDPCAPWKGCGPLELADQTGSLVGAWRVR